MNILEIKFKNFKSYGNKLVTLNFEKDYNSTITLLSGKNGFGKTSLKEVLEFAAYGRVDGLTLSDLPNRTNKKTYTYIKFLTKQRVIEIERGLEPAKFVLKINGKLYDEANKRNIQTYIEDELFEIPYNVFKNVVSLSVDNFKSFLKMTPKDKRDIIDRIFGFDVLNKMIESIKEDKKAKKLEYDKIGFEISSLNSTISDLEGHLKNIKLDTSNEYSNEISNLETTLSEHKLALEPLKKDYDIYRKSLESSKLSLNTERNAMSDLKNEVLSVNKDYALYSNNKCAVCGSDLKTDDHLKKKDDLKTQLQVLKKSLLNQQTAISDLENSYKTLLTKYTTVSDRILNVNSKINVISNELASLIKRSKKEAPNVASIKDMITDYKSTFNSKKKVESSLIVDTRFFEKVTDILSTDGIRKMVMSNVVPLLNNNISEFLLDLDINFSIVIDDSFDVVIQSLGKPINVKTLSKGETVRVDVAILLSLIKLIKLQYPTLNILFLDEIFSNIDLDSINGIIEIIKRTGTDLGLSVFLVSHSPVDETNFDRKLVLEKINTFTELRLDSL